MFSGPVGSAPPRVSVVMPVYNAATTLNGAVSSIQHQTFQHWELVVVDDGSEDDSGEILAELARKDHRIRIISTPHQGIVDSLCAGIAESKGEFIARMDADDISLPERLDVQLKCLEGKSEVGLCGGRVRVVGDKLGFGRRRYEEWINSLLSHDQIVREIFVECSMPHPTFMRSRTWYERAGGYRDLGWPEDYDLVMRLWMAGAKFAKPEPVILEWRDHPTRLSMTDARYSETAFRALKRHFLFESGVTGGRPLYQWGAGEVGKRWLREWGNMKPIAVVDVNPRKIGRTIHGVPVIAPDALPEPGTCFVVIMVGIPGARENIRYERMPAGYREGDDFLFLA